MANAVPTLPQLRSYVSSHKTDVFKCHSDRSDTFFTPPYACAYSHGMPPTAGCGPRQWSDRFLAAKRGSVPHLAVATEQGTVYIWDTSKREELGQGQLSQSVRISNIVTTTHCRREAD